MNGISRTQMFNSIKKHGVQWSVYAVFLAYLIYSVMRVYLNLNMVSNYLSTAIAWVGYGRYFFILILLLSFLGKEDNIRFFVKCIVSEYIIHFLLTYFFLVNFTESSFMLFWDLAAYTFCYVLCPAIVAWLIGRVCARIRNDIAAVCTVLFFGGIFSFNIIQEVLLFFNLNERWYTFFSRLFIIFNNSLRDTFAAPNEFAPFDISRINVGVALFWVCLFLMVLGMQRKKKATIILTIPLISAVFLGAQTDNEYYVYSNNSFFSMNKHMEDSWNNDQMYYENRGLRVTEREPIQVNAEYVVEKYDMEITCGTKTKFVTTAYISSTDAEKYVFSLYHGYMVKKITDMDGNLLVYSQDGDKITINSNGKSLSQIKFVYEGTGMTYMASDSYTCLPEYYIYYPIPGEYILYDTQALNYVKNLKLSEAEFHITVNAKYDVFSNIPEVADNEFQGTVTGPMLIGGKYLRCAEENGAIIIYSVLTDNEESVRMQYNHLTSLYLNNGVDFTGKAWFTCPYYGGNFGRYYVGEAYLFGNYEELVINMPLTYGFQNTEVIK